MLVGVVWTIQRGKSLSLALEISDGFCDKNGDKISVTKFNCCSFLTIIIIYCSSNEFLQLVLSVSYCFHSVNSGVCSAYSKHLRTRTDSIKRSSKICGQWGPLVEGVLAR